MKKKFIILMILILLTGCTVKSNVTVNYDGTVTESVTILNDNSSFSSPKKTKEAVISNILDNYSPVLNYKKYSEETVIGDDESGAKITKKYDNICSYFQDTAANQYVYPHIKCTESEYYYEIENDTDYIPYCPDCSDWPILDNITYSLTLPVKAEEDNADYVNDNTYTWEFDKNTVSKDFYLKISKSLLEKNKEKEENKLKVKNIFKYILYVLIAIILLGLLIYGCKKLYKKYKENQIEY